MIGVFISNFFNHHQRPFMDALNIEMDGICYFIQTVPLPKDRIELGYVKEYPDYVIDVSEITINEFHEKYGKLLMDADFVIYNNAEPYVERRLISGKLTFLADERFCKVPYTGIGWIKKYISIWKHVRRYRGLYFLGMSAYFAGDLSGFGMKTDRMYNWGYFPPSFNTKYVVKVPIDNRNIEILWASRFLRLKHPEMVLKLAKRLK